MSSLPRPDAPASPSGSAPVTASPARPIVRIIHYLPVFAWMLVIFLASTDLGSSAHTSRIIRPFLQWLNPNVTEETVKLVQAIIRKTGHVSEYAVLAFLLWRARRLTHAIRGWVWREFWIVITLCAAYASTDEFHQLFVSSRQASVLDVFIDTSGAAIALLIIRSILRLRRTSFTSAPP